MSEIFDNETDVELVRLRYQRLLQERDAEVAELQRSADTNWKYTQDVIAENALLRKRIERLEQMLHSGNGYHR